MAGDLDTWEFYRDRRGEWRWRRWGISGKIIGQGHAGFAALADCKANAARVPYVEGTSKEICNERRENQRAIDRA